MYPIRTTRRKWDIKLYRYHNCTEYCGIKVVNDYEYPEQLLIIDNPNYKNNKCEKYKKVEPTLIRIVDYDDNNANIGDIGKLYNSDSKVIPNNSFTILLSFPLSYMLEINIISDNNGFSLKDVIKYIKIFYEFIYEEEERTSTAQVYNLKKKCYSCMTKDMLKYIRKIEPPSIETECPICCSNYEEDDNISQLQCSHIFHNDCIKKWFINSGTCPMCRSNVFECKNCDGSGIINYQFSGILIPVENRSGNLNRNMTNGIFGIYNYDLDDLFIESLKYDRIKKRLNVNIISM